ncbi:hypothetical protein [Imhoffiella purpurea]|uniref:Acetyltransferase n=1 Tax=Imhoffiella purpurea TaxID=1249627 RepID=W9V510_9GAMM|nr:hypothetical protein [Imhoffiella purpurea]EXJ14638.1 hypothetical protein D779_2332 [Imhoffiella purpurea]
MQHFDVFNGDADGLCALQQLRLAEPRDSILVTGPKREVDLLARVPSGAACGVTVLDISMEKNRAALDRLLAEGARVSYFDHHHPGEIPSHSGLEVHIETLPDKGTSLLVDDYLGGRHRAWALVGTFGDNFDRSARRAAESMELEEADIARLRQLGILLNYNGYGARVEDLHYAPDDLFRRLRPYADPLAFIAEDDAFAALLHGYEADMSQVGALRPEFEDEGHRLFILPSEPWARRASGVFANDLAQREPGRAHAILTQLADGGFLVSVRAPLERPVGADVLCRRFATGGGRKAAAGINRLAESEYECFVDAFVGAFRD